MLTMSQINHIKDLSNCGYCISEISEKTGADLGSGPCTGRFWRSRLLQSRECLLQLLPLPKKIS